MNRPLRDLPLDRFIHRPAHSSNPFAVAPNPNSLKRPGSPTAQSPSAKRRLLSIEGHSSSSPGCSKPIPHSIYVPVVDYTAILSGPDSPARKLDFASVSISKTPSRSDDTEATPRPRTRAATRAALAPLDSDPKARCNGSSSSTSGTSGSLPARLQSHPLVYELIPRPTPPVPDASNEHFPGFFVYPDPYTVVARPDETRSLAEQVWYDEQPEKENTEPPRQIHGLASVLDSPSKSRAAFSMSVAKGKIASPALSYLSAAHRKIYGSHMVPVEDSIDLSETYSYSRQAALSSNTLDDDQDRL